MNVLLLGLLLCCVLFFLSACSDQSSIVSPSGTVTIDSSYESSSSGTKICYITLLVKNSGSTKIKKSTISLSAKTNTRSYKVSNVYQVTILSGESVYFSPTISYDSTTETAASADIAVIDFFFE